MKRVRFDRMGVVGGETVYALRIDGQLVREHMTLGAVIRYINQQTELEEDAKPGGEDEP